MIAELIEDGRLFEWRKARKGTNPQKLIARFPEPPPELDKMRHAHTDSNARKTVRVGRARLYGQTRTRPPLLEGVFVSVCPIM